MDDDEKLRDAIIAGYRGHESRSVGKLELAKLSMRGAIAVTLRALVRVCPVLKPHPKDVSADQIKAVAERCVVAGMDFIEGKELGVNLPDLIEWAKAVARRPSEGSMVADGLAHLVKAIDRATAGDAESVVDETANGLFCAVSEAPLTDQEAGEEMDKMLAGRFIDQGPAVLRDAIADDYAAVVALGTGDYPSLGKPFAATIDGPLGKLWPDDPPEWWPKS